MQNSRTKHTAAILGAGLGSRVESLTHAKPLLFIGGRTLLERLLLQLAQMGFERIIIALREELLSPEDLDRLPRPRGVEYLLVNTPSSLHTLAEVVNKAGAKDPLFVTMVDTVLKAPDLRAYWDFCQSLPQNSSAILGTKFIDDEKPLYVQTGPQDRITGFGPMPSGVVTSGMYYLSVEAQNAVKPAVNSGMEKMRNFLSSLITSGQTLNLFVVEKSLDIDRPEDLVQAEKFV